MAMASDCYSEDWSLNPAVAISFFHQKYKDNTKTRITEEKTSGSPKMKKKIEEIMWKGRKEKLSLGVREHDYQMRLTMTRHVWTPETEQRKNGEDSLEKYELADWWKS